MKRVLIYDIETTYFLARTWRIGHKLTLNHDQIYENFLGGRSKIICVAYKWAHEKAINLIHSGVNFENEADLIKQFDEIVETADVVLAHNGDHFDMKHFNTARLIHRLPPVMWPTSEDTLKVLRRNFNLPSNRLDYVAKKLTGKGKDSMSYNDWIQIVEHQCMKSRLKMFKYCKRDVQALDDVAKIVMPYVSTTVSRAYAKKQPGECSNPVCTTPHIRKSGVMQTLRGRFQKYHCTSCGHNHTGERL
jgi:hypothetical protein